MHHSCYKEATDTVTLLHLTDRLVWCRLFSGTLLLIAPQAASSLLSDLFLLFPAFVVRHVVITKPCHAIQMKG